MFFKKSNLSKLIFSITFMIPMVPAWKIRKAHDLADRIGKQLKGFGFKSTSLDLGGDDLGSQLPDNGHEPRQRFPIDF
jgi:hypothetical protein